MLAVPVPAVPVESAGRSRVRRARARGLSRWEVRTPVEAVIIFGVVYAAFLIGRLLQYLSDAKRVLGRGGDKDGKR